MTIDALIDTLSPEAQRLRHDPEFRAFVRWCMWNPGVCGWPSMACFFPDAPARYVLAERRPSMESSAEYQRD